MILDFFKISANLKNIERQGWVDKLEIKNPESVADHTFSMAVMGMILSDLKNMNTEKILKMVLLHDLAESVVGDFTPEQISKEKKIIIENETFKKILKNLPGTLNVQYLQLWKDYQSNVSQEARLVHQLDRLEMALQAKIYAKNGHTKENIESFLNTSKNEIADPTLRELLEKILEE